MIARGRYLNRQKQLDDTKIPEELRQLRGLKVLVTRHNVDINLRYDQKILSVPETVVFKNRQKARVKSGLNTL